MTELAAPWRAAARIGPYFAVELDASGPAWIPLATLVGDVSALREYVASIRALLAQRCGVPVERIDLRATASVQFLGLAARLLSPTLAVAVLSGTAPRLAVSDVRWRPVRGGPIRIAVDAWSYDSGPDLATRLYEGLVATCVAPLADVVQQEFRLSSKVMWGNVASAVAGAAKMLCAARPDLAEQATNLADRLLHKGLLVGTGRYVVSDVSTPDRYFVRNNCCLFYRVPGGGTCADCVLVPR